MDGAEGDAGRDAEMKHLVETYQYRRPDVYQVAAANDPAKPAGAVVPVLFERHPASPAGELIGYIDGHVEFVTPDRPAQARGVRARVTDGQHTIDADEVRLRVAPPATTAPVAGERSEGETNALRQQLAAARASWIDAKAAFEVAQAASGDPAKMR